jgi:hypothetical protein
MAMFAVRDIRLQPVPAKIKLKDFSRGSAPPLTAIGCVWAAAMIDRTTALGAKNGWNAAGAERPHLGSSKMLTYGRRGSRTVARNGGGSSNRARVHWR